MGTVEARDVCRIGATHCLNAIPIVCVRAIHSVVLFFLFCFFSFHFIGEKAAITRDKYINIGNRTNKKNRIFLFYWLVCIERVMLCTKYIRPSSNSRACKITSQIVHVFPKRYANRWQKKRERNKIDARYRFPCNTRVYIAQWQIALYIDQCKQLNSNYNYS